MQDIPSTLALIVKAHDYAYYGTPYKSSPSDSYNCSVYKQSSHRFNTICSNHHISTKVVRELILDMIKKVCFYVKENQAEFVEKIREESTLQRGEAAKSYKKLIAKNEKRIVDLDNLFRRIYEDNASGKLSEELTTPMLNSFVDKIFAHKAEKNEWGERSQMIDVHFNFIGDFKLPEAEPPEPTPEELATLEKERIARQKRHDSCKRWRDKKRAEQQNTFA